MSESPLNPDELAAAYLKSRDVPCPNCAYNRRGGVTAACPECGHDLAILHEDGGWKQQHRQLATRILTMLLVLCIVQVLMSGYATIFWLNMAIFSAASSMTLYLYLIQGVVGLIAYFALSIFTVRVRRRTRSDQEITATKVSSPMLAYLIVTILLWLSSFMYEFF